MHRLRYLRQSMSYGSDYYGGGGRKMIRVKVFPPYGCDHRALDERSWMEIKEESTVKDVLKIIRLNSIKVKLLLVSVNGERVSLSRKLQDGDVIGFISPVSGG